MKWRNVVALAIIVGCLLVLTFLCTQPAHSQTQGVTLQWTATGDDSTSGAASGYLIFWSPTTPDTTGLTAWLNSGGSVLTTPTGILTWVNQAKNVAGPTPLLAGSAQSFTVSDSFAGGGKYWFMVRTCDDALNCVRSNFATKTVPVVDVWPPKVIRDLLAR